MVEITAARKSVIKVGDGVSRQFVVPHNLGTTDIVANVWYANELIADAIVWKDSTNISLSFNFAPEKDGVTVVVFG